MVISTSSTITYIFNPKEKAMKQSIKGTSRLLHFIRMPLSVLINGFGAHVV